jgi:hypothetical protein
MLLENILGDTLTIVIGSLRMLEITSPRSIYTLSSISQRTAKQKNMKIEEQLTRLSILLGDAKNLRETLV